MSAVALESTEPPDSAADDAEFDLDMRVVESTTRLVIMMCETDDGCGSTCSTSACITESNNPF